MVFERVKGQGENAQDKWRRVSPNAGDADRDKVDAMLAKLANMRATSFVDGKGALSPALEIHVKFDDGKKEERVAFVRDGADVLALLTPHDLIVTEIRYRKHQILSVMRQPKILVFSSLVL